MNTRYPPNSQMPNGLSHTHWSNNRRLYNENNNPPQQIQAPSPQLPQQGSMNSYQTWTSTTPHMTPSIQQQSMASSRQIQQPNIADLSSCQLEPVQSPGWQNANGMNNNWQGQGPPVLKTEPLSPPPCPPSSTPNSQEGKTCKNGRFKNHMNTNFVIQNDK
jgi:hypothetical protein